MADVEKLCNSGNAPCSIEDIDPTIIDYIFIEIMSIVWKLHALVAHN